MQFYNSVRAQVLRVHPQSDNRGELMKSLYKYVVDLNHSSIFLNGTAPLLSLFLAAVLAAPAGADQKMQSHSEIESVVRGFIVDKIGEEYPSHQINIGTLDPRLRLPVCEGPLHVFLPPGGRLPGNSTIGVSCQSQAPWTVYVSAAVKVKSDVVVIKHSIARNATITAQDVMLETRDLSGSEAFIRDPAQAIGKVAKRDLAFSTAITPSMLAAPLLIRRGQQVVIIATAPGMDVRMQGVALNDGAAGERVQVRNQLSKRIVEATVIEAGVAQVTM